MRIVRTARLLGICSAATVLGLFAFSAPASAATAGVSKGTINGGEADFGTGAHYLGSPTGPYTVTWDYSVSGGTLIKTAHIHGYLYVDKLFGGGCARLKILYLNLAGTTITSQTSQFCGPGGDANNQTNQFLVDAQKSSVDIARVRLTIAAGSSTSTFVDGPSATWTEPQIAIQQDTLNNGDWTYTLFDATTNFGVHIFPSEFFGDPYGSMDASLYGFLTASDLITTPRVVFDYIDANGVIFDQDVWDIGPGSGFTPFSSRFNVANIFKVRVRLGETGPAGGFFNVVSKTYAFGPAVGDAECLPFDTTAVVNDPASTSLQWTVPNAASWHTLDTVDVRLIDDAGEILQVQWNEASNEFLFLNQNSGQYEGPAAPGSNDRFERPEVAMLLSDTQVVGSGPQGPSVVLTLGLRFKPKAAGRVFRVEARASDKNGTAQGWASAGTITVLPKR
jgi:hypothetical protein